MRQTRHSLAALVVLTCFALGACGSGGGGDDTPAAAAGSDATAAGAPIDTAGAAAAQQPATGGSIDCAAVKAALAKIIINWQVVIGLPNTATTQWATLPQGTLSEFGDQLATVTAALSSDADAADALQFMSGANEIVQRGLGGDAAAQADLAAYMGTDTGANFAKQSKIAVAYQHAGCK
jgi:hypothetical protein